jgi:polyisoprenoid-binding protein YceI
MTTDITDVVGIAPGRYRLDLATTTVEFETRHLFGLASVRGQLALVSGMADIGYPMDESLVRAELDAASFRTDNPRRDRAVRGHRYLDVEAHPTFLFVGDRLENEMLSGTLTVRGATQPVSLHITRLHPDENGFVVEATARIDRYAFGVTASRGLAARYLRVSVRTRGVREEETGKW